MFCKVIKIVSYCSLYLVQKKTVIKVRCASSGAMQTKEKHASTKYITTATATTRTERFESATLAWAWATSEAAASFWKRLHFWESREKRNRAGGRDWRPATQLGNLGGVSFERGHECYGSAEESWTALESW